MKNAQNHRYIRGQGEAEGNEPVISGTHTHTPFNPTSLTVLLAPSDSDFVNNVNR